MARMFDPPHPGLTLRDDVLPALGLSVTKAADQLGVSRVALSRVINGNAAISPELAIRLEAWLGADRGGAARLWLGSQSDYDEWQARRRIAKTMHVRRAPKVKAVPQRSDAAPDRAISRVRRGTKHNLGAEV